MFGHLDAERAGAAGDLLRDDKIRVAYLGL